MQFHRDSGKDLNLISALGERSLRVGESEVTGSCIVSANTLVSDWRVANIDALDAAALAPILEMRPEIVLLGSGVVLRFPDSSIRQRFAEAGIGLEVMDTAAACRTYNVLVHEGRQVVAALIIDQSASVE